MPADLNSSLVIGISSRALFDLEAANHVFETKGEEAYCRYQEQHETEVLRPGVGFQLVRALLNLNQATADESGRLAEVVVVSRNSPATSIRLFHSIQQYGLDIQRAVLTSGTPVARYLKAFSVDLYLSAHPGDVTEALENGIAAGVIYQPTAGANCRDDDKSESDTKPESIDPCEELRIAFDGDNVLFDGEAEDVFQDAGLSGFVEHETRHMERPLRDGPFARLFRTIAEVQRTRSQLRPRIRTALVTARSLPTHLRVLNTFRQWGLHVDEAFFMGGVDKSAVLAAFRPHLFFDDQAGHCQRAAGIVSTARVPTVKGRRAE
jgi:5'-nucleotidase